MDDVRSLPARHRLTVDRFEEMATAGIFGEQDRIELIDGELIDMAPIGAAHAASVSGLAEALVLACAGRATVWPQNPVLLDGSSLPQPDLAVLRRRADFYAAHRPGQADILLLIEVADSSLHFDRTVKLPRYAQAGIAESWLVDLTRRTLEAHRHPTPTGYTEITTHLPGDRLALALAPEIIVTLGPIFGPTVD